MPAGGAPPTRSGKSRGKSPGAFRTISEVSDTLNVPAHVLRFWETKFTQVRPMKRGGGRRYYRPEDIALLTRIRDLLYSDGYTIKGVQKLLKSGGANAPAATAAKPAPASPPAAAQPAAPAPQAATPAAPAQTPLPPPAPAGLTSDQREVLKAALAELEEVRSALKTTGE